MAARVIDRGGSLTSQKSISPAKLPKPPMQTNRPCELQMIVFRGSVPNSNVYGDARALLTNQYRGLGGLYHSIPLHRCARRTTPLASELGSKQRTESHDEFNGLCVCVWRLTVVNRDEAFAVRTKADALETSFADRDRTREVTVAVHQMQSLLAEVALVLAVHVQFRLDENFRRVIRPEHKLC